MLERDIRLRSLNASGFHERAGRCQENLSIVLLGDRTRGACPSCGGSRHQAAWGEPSRPDFPLGGTGKGDSRFLPCRRRLFALLCACILHYLRIADSPCFHSHSLVEHLLRCQLVSFIFETGAAISDIELSPLPRERSFRRKRAVTRTRRFALEPNSSQAAFFCAASRILLFRSGS